MGVPAERVHPRIARAGETIYNPAVKSHFDSAAGGETIIDLAVSRQGEGFSHEVGPHTVTNTYRERERKILRGERE